MVHKNLRNYLDIVAKIVEYLLFRVTYKICILLYITIYKYTHKIFILLRFHFIFINTNEKLELEIETYV